MPFGLHTPKTFNYLGLQSFGYERAFWLLLQKCNVRTNLVISKFFFNRRYRKPKEQSRKDNPDTLTTLKTEDEDKQNKKTQHYTHKKT